MVAHLNYTDTQTQKFETLRHRTDDAKMSLVRSVLGPKCPYTLFLTVQLLLHRKNMTEAYRLTHSVLFEMQSSDMNKDKQTFSEISSFAFSLTLVVAIICNSFLLAEVNRNRLTGRQLRTITMS